MRNKSSISIYLDDQLKNAVEETARLRNISVSELFRAIFRDWQRREHQQIIDRVAKAGIISDVVAILELKESEAQNGA